MKKFKNININIKRRGHTRVRRAENIQGFLLAVLPIVRFVIFGFVPMAAALVMAFMKMDTFSITDGYYCGLENFGNIIADKQFWGSILNTFYLALSLPISLFFSLVVSILLAGKISFAKFFRTALFIPFVCSVVAVTLMWRWLLDYNYGIVNQLFNIDINWRGDPDWYIPGLIMMSVWSSMAYKIILLSAALTQVNENYYEAAELDGAGSFKKLWHITLPAISPTVFFLVVIGVINILQEFVRSQVWDPAGGPNGKGLTIVFYLYRHAFQYIDMGAASAVAWLLSVIILILTFINFKLKDRWVYD